MSAKEANKDKAMLSEFVKWFGQARQQSTAEALDWYWAKLGTFKLGFDAGYALATEQERGLVANALKRQGMTATPNDKELNCISGKRFESDTEQEKKEQDALRKVNERYEYYYVSEKQEKQRE